MDRTKAKLIQQYMKANGIFAALEKQFGVQVSVGSASYSDTNMGLKLDISDVVNGEVIKPEVTAWKEFTQRGKTFKISGLNPKGRQMPVLATSGGKTYKFPVYGITMVLGLLSPSKRTEEQILKDIRDVHCQLSPENLSCDGELSRAETVKKERELNNKLAVLERELGYKPTDAYIDLKLNIESARG